MYLLVVMRKGIHFNTIFEVVFYKLLFINFTRGKNEEKK